MLAVFTIYALVNGDLAFIIGLIMTIAFGVSMFRQEYWPSLVHSIKIRKN